MEKEERDDFSHNSDNPALFSSVAFIAWGLEKNKSSFPFFPPHACLSGFCLPIGETSDGIVLGPKQRQQLLLWQDPCKPQSCQHKAFCSFCHSLGSICWDVTPPRAEQGARGRGSSPHSSRCCSSLFTSRLGKWRHARSSRLLGSGGVVTCCHASSSSLLSASDLGRYRVSGSTKNISYCWLLGCKTTGTRAGTGRVSEVRFSKIHSSVLARQYHYFLVWQCVCL